MSGRVLFLRAAVAFGLAGGAAGCPQTSPSALRIDRIEVDGDERGADFDLIVSGAGFIRAVDYDLGSKRGTLGASDLAVEIRGNGGYESRPEFAVLSATTLRVKVRGGPLPPEVYELALLLTEKQQASAVLFDLREIDGERDGGVIDTGVVDDPDGGDPLDGGMRDGGPGRDGGFRDGGPPDSGLGDFAGAFGWRRPILVGSPTSALAGVTIRVPVPHAALVTEGKAEPDGSDLAVYQGADRLDFAWDDRVAVGTDQLAMIVRLLRDLPAAGPTEGDALALYYGDPNAGLQPTEAVFEFVERFATEVSPVDRGNDNAWSSNEWAQCNNARPSQVEEPPHSYCVCDDDNDNPARRTLASPRMRTIQIGAPATTNYESSVWLAGQTQDGTADILFFSQGPDNDNFAATILFNNADFVEFPPNGAVTFEETNGADRTVQGWQFPAATVQWWTRSRLHFRPAIDEPSLHFRYISTNGNGYPRCQSGVVIDDWWIRWKMIDPPTLTFGPEEAR